MRSKSILVGSMLLLGCWVVTPALGQTTWDGGTGNWFTDGNWTNGVPDQTTDASIGGFNQTVTIDDAAATLDFVHGITTELAITGAGELIIHGDATLNGTSTLTGDGDFTVQGAATWGNFKMAGSSSATFESDLTIDGLPSPGAGAFTGTVNGRTLNTQGNTLWNDNDSNFVLENGATWNNSGTLTRDIGSSNIDLVLNSNTFNNTGSFIKTGSTSDFDVQGGTFNNSGTVSSQEGAVTFTGEFNSSSGSLVEADGGNITFSADFNNNGGTIRSVGGNSITIGTYAHNDGVLAVESGGSIEANSMNIAAGGIEGVGTLNSNVDLASGTYVAPGSSAGQLDVEGNFAMAGGSEFRLELGGLDPSEFDVLNVIGDVTIGDDAELLVSFIDGFAPSVGDSFDFLTFTETASGNNWIVNFDESGYEGDVSLNSGSGNYSLSVSAVPEPSSLVLLVGVAGTLAFRRRRVA